jgi:hypothetical protein
VFDPLLYELPMKRRLSQLMAEHDSAGPFIVGRRPGACITQNG